jgi:hypothetical protein
MQTGDGGIEPMKLFQLFPRMVWKTIVPVLFVSLSVRDAAAADEWRNAYKVGDQVELHITGNFWQKCVVTENTPESVMKGRCEEFVEPPPGTYSRAGGVYILSQSDTRPARATSKATPRPSVTGSVRGSAQGSAKATSRGPGGFALGDKVEIEASGHWVPCMVVENHPDAIMRVSCEEYPALSRAAGVYTVDRDNPRAVRRATGKIGKIATPAPTPRPAAGPAGLKVGEYACYGSGGRILAGLGFEVLPGNRYTDLEDDNEGSFSISGTTVTFRGGHLGGQTGRDLRGHSFTLGAQAECEPY